MRTRAAAKRAAAEALTVEVPNVANTLDIPAAKDGPTKTTKTRIILKTKTAVVVSNVAEPPAKKIKVAKRTRAAKPTLSADVLPHGLGKIHTIQHPNNDLAETGKQDSAPDSESHAITSDSITPIVFEFVQNIIEKAVDSVAHDTASVTGILKTPLSPPPSQASHGRILRPRPPSKPVGCRGVPLPTPETSFAESTEEASLVIVQEEVQVKKPKREMRRTKTNPYGLMPGRTPFPGHAAPSPEACFEVHRILTETHGEFKPPAKFPAPSTSVAGCGEVPDLVDALIRTLISGHTAMANANLAIQDVIAQYGQWDADSIGAGSIDWNKVRLSEEAEVVNAVKRAGLGPTKGKDIKLILEQVYQDNQERMIAYAKEKATGEITDMSGACELTQGQKDHQLLKIKNGVLTLDHIRGMSPDEAMLEFTRFPGIGVKTASCLVLFCLQQPSFAVDTHVWRFCKWLGWVPPKASRDDTYMHGEVRIPNELKYGLHQLFIRHGKECGRCRSGTVEGTPEWEGLVCPMEHLLDRFDKRKTKVQPKPKKAKKTEVANDSDEEEESNEAHEASIDSDHVDNRPEHVSDEENPAAGEAAPSSGGVAAESPKPKTRRLVVQLRKRKRMDYTEYDFDA